MDDWQIGDLALCVKREPWRNGSTMRNGGPKSGQTFIVEEIYPASDDGTLMLAFPEYPFEGFAARHFRKIKPLSDQERDSFLADLDAPVSPAVPDGRRPVTAQRGTGHLSPAAPLSASLPGPSAAHTPCLADGSGLPDHVAAHAATANN